MRTRPAALVLVLAVAAGCTTTSEGSPGPASTSDTTVESTDPTPPSAGSAEPSDRELPYAGAPKVDNPLDTTRFQQDPCKALTTAQAEELNVTSPGEPREAPLGNACKWPSTVDRIAYVELVFLDENPYGLSATYQANEDGDYVFFNKLPPIEGYPAVSTDIVDDRDNGKCPVAVGVTDQIAFGLFVRLSAANVGQKDPCETAAMVAGMALRTMKEGA